MAGRLDGKVALVTGAASGIGRATVFALAREGARVAATDLAAPDLAAPELGAGAEAGLLCLAQDVTDEPGWGRTVEAVVARFGGLDVLVNNAGIGGAGPLLETDLAGWRRVIAVNLEAVFLGTRVAVSAMQANPRPFAGAIVNVSSVLGLVGAQAGSSAYSASKGAVRLFSKSCALECAAAARPVRVNSVHPGYIDTPLLARRLAEQASGTGRDVTELAGAIVARHPLGRLGRPDEIAAGILYLASEEAAFVTGAELVIDGGYTAQ